ncbi:GNAT family N-acetyltransferase [Actinocorallia populi]|uniref:GNAT family N-acetyltransferase n=1 Tax=Actinocorallia populi TaxID=2079200 RepID=UPI000D08F874|nr:GNAT family N-acetyltransferase [Actinocorallia populi]
MAEPFVLRLATDDDVEEITRLIDETGSWLRDKIGTDQWNRPWPDEAARNARVRDGVARGRTWLLRDGGTLVASVTVEVSGTPGLWTERELRVPAVYLHRLVVDRHYKGMRIGEFLIGRGAQRGLLERPSARELRIDTWSTNDRLHEYYIGLGFSKIHGIRVTEDETPSGQLLSKPIRDVRPCEELAGILHVQEEGGPARAEQAEPAGQL